jgi:hypothetical protein
MQHNKINTTGGEYFFKALYFQNFELVEENDRCYLSNLDWHNW